MTGLTGISMKFSRDDLILFDVCLDRGAISDYFIYHAHPKHPSLHMITDPAEPCASSFRNTGIVRCGGGADDFAVAAPYWDKGVFNLTVFSSRTGAWTTRVAPVEPSQRSRLQTNQGDPAERFTIGLGRCVGRHHVLRYPF
jgi:hypothetical protein